MVQASAPCPARSSRATGRSGGKSERQSSTHCGAFLSARLNLPSTRPEISSHHGSETTAATRWDTRSGVGDRPSKKRTRWRGRGLQGVPPSRSSALRLPPTKANGFVHDPRRGTRGGNASSGKASPRLRALSQQTNLFLWASKSRPLRVRGCPCNTRHTPRSSSALSTRVLSLIDHHALRDA